MGVGIKSKILVFLLTWEANLAARVHIEKVIFFANTSIVKVQYDVNCNCLYSPKFLLEFNQSDELGNINFRAYRETHYLIVFFVNSVIGDICHPAE